MRIKQFILVTFVIFCPGQGFSQAQGPVNLGKALEALEGTLSARSLPQFQGGELNACSIEFNAVARDTASGPRRYVKIGGSFGFIKTNANVGAILKVIVHDLDSRTMTLTPSPPIAAFVASGLQNNQKSIVSAYPSDTPGALFVVFQLEPTAQFYIEALTNSRLKLFISRKAGGFDVPVEIDLGVQDTDNEGKRTKSDQAVTEMFECVQTLFRSLQK